MVPCLFCLSSHQAIRNPGLCGPGFFIYNKYVKVCKYYCFCRNNIVYYVLFLYIFLYELRDVTIPPKPKKAKPFTIHTPTAKDQIGDDYIKNRLP